MHPTIIKLKEVIDSMPDECPEKGILLVVYGNMLCGKSSRPLAELAYSMAKQYRKELDNPK